MSSDQRKAVLVLIDLLYGNLPATNTVALFARSAELTLVNVRVAIGALRSYIAEHRLGVALRAVDAFVHASQGKVRLIVIELHVSTNGLPPAHRMAILTGNV